MSRALVLALLLASSARGDIVTSRWYLGEASCTEVCANYSALNGVELTCRVDRMNAFHVELYNMIVDDVILDQSDREHPPLGTNDYPGGADDQKWDHVTGKYIPKVGGKIDTCAGKSEGVPPRRNNGLGAANASAPYIYVRSNGTVGCVARTTHPAFAGSPNSSCDAPASDSLRYEGPPPAGNYGDVLPSPAYDGVEFDDDTVIKRICCCVADGEDEKSLCALEKTDCGEGYLWAGKKGLIEYHMDGILCAAVTGSPTTGSKFSSPISLSLILEPPPPPPPPPRGGGGGYLLGVPFRIIITNQRFIALC